jgi:serine protease AprX
MRKITLLITFCFFTAGQICAQAYVDSKLKDAMAKITKTTSLEVVVTFKGKVAPSTLDIAALTQAGIKQGLTMRALPIAGIIATVAQVGVLARIQEFFRFTLMNLLNTIMIQVMHLQVLIKYEKNLNLPSRMVVFLLQEKA